MSNGFQGTQWLTGAGSTDNTMRLLAQAMMMPFSAFIYSMQMFMQMMPGMPGMQGAINRSGEMTTSRCTQPCGCAQTGGGGQRFGGESGVASGLTVNPETHTGGPAIARSAGNAQSTTQKEERKMNEQNWGCREDTWKISDECKDTEPCDRLKLVRFKVLFLKNNLEAAFQEEEELVTEEVTKEGFISWKVAEFIQKMGRGEVRQPTKWREENNYPEHEGGTIERRDNVNYVITLPDADKRFLRVYSEVLCWYDRERRNYERDQVGVLAEIRDELRKHRRGVGGRAENE